MNNSKETQSKELQLTKELEASKMDALERGLSNSLSSVNLIRDYISVLQLKYNGKNDPESLMEINALLFNDNVLTHIDSMLDDMSLSIDDTLAELIERRDNNSK